MPPGSRAEVLLFTLGKKLMPGKKTAAQKA
jgi:hypothetical protein